METKGAGRFKVVFLLAWLIFLVGCAGHAHQHRDEPLPPPAYADSETAQAMNEGNRHFKEGWWTGAEKKYRIAIQAFPSLAEAHFNIGLALHRQAHFAEARSHFMRAVQLNPRNAVYRNAPSFRRHGEVTSETEPEGDSDGHSH